MDHWSAYQETWLRLWRLEENHETIKSKLKDHQKRIETLEEKPSESIFSVEHAKEVGMILALGALIGSMVTARDPAGALLIVEKLLSK